MHKQVRFPSVKLAFASRSMGVKTARLTAILFPLFGGQLPAYSAPLSLVPEERARPPADIVRAVVTDHEPALLRMDGIVVTVPNSSFPTGTILRLVEADLYSMYIESDIPVLRRPFRVTASKTPAKEASIVLSLDPLSFAEDLETLREFDDNSTGTLEVEICGRKLDLHVDYMFHLSVWRETASDSNLNYERLFMVGFGESNFPAEIEIPFKVSNVIAIVDGRKLILSERRHALWKKCRDI